MGRRKVIATMSELRSVATTAHDRIMRQRPQGIDGLLHLQTTADMYTRLANALRAKVRAEKRLYRHEPQAVGVAVQETNGQ